MVSSNAPVRRVASPLACWRLSRCWPVCAVLLCLLAAGALPTRSHAETVSSRWSVLYDSDATDYAWDVAVDGVGDVAMSGDSGTDNYTAKYAGDTGALRWSKRTPNSGSPLVWADAQGNVFAVFAKAADFSIAHLIKYDAADGDVLWDIALPGLAHAISGDSAGNVCVAGMDTHPTAPMFVGRYAAADGAQLWLKRRAPNANSVTTPRSVKTDAAGNVYVSGGGAAATDLSGQIFVVKYAVADGALLWGRSYTAPNVERPVLAVNAAGDAAIATHSRNGSVFDLYMAKWAANGTPLWAQSLTPDLNFGQLFGVAMDAQGNVLATGHVGRSGTPNRTFFVCKRAATDGALLWSARPATGTGEFVAADANGDVIATGLAPASANSQILTTKLAGADGALRWGVLTEHTTNEVSGLALRSNGDAIVAGYQSGVSPDLGDIFVAAYQSSPPERFGDLLIKEAAQPDAAFSTDDIYVPAAVGRQLREASFKPEAGAAAEFDFEIQNDADTPKTFRLLGTETGDTGWKVEALLGGTDRWAAMTAGGFPTGSMQPGAKLRFRLRLTGENADEALPLGTKHAVEIFAVDDATPGVTEDAIGAKVETITALIVNSTGDEPDADPDDDVADVDKKKPGLQITLRAAIQFANAREGKDLIEFDIPEKGNKFEDGVPTIKPKTPLPVIIDTVTIDGWSQDPAATRPPIQLRGNLVPRLTTAAAEQERRLAPFLDPSGHFILDRETLYPDAVLDSPDSSGLVLRAPGCEVRGLTINHFPLCGLLVEGEGSIIQGNFLGMDPTGKQPRGNGMASNFEGSNFLSIGPYLITVRGAQLCLKSGGNLVGGASARERNLISGNWGQIYQATGGRGSFDLGNKPTPGPGDAFSKPPNLFLFGPEASNNTIIGNYIGCDADGQALWVKAGIKPSNFRFGDASAREPIVGLYIAGGRRNRIGGSLPAEANSFGGCYFELFMEGAGNTATGNNFVRDPTVRPLVRVGGVANELEQSLGLGEIFVTHADGAVIRGNEVLEFGITVSGSRTTRVENNRLNSSLRLAQSEGAHVEGNLISNSVLSAVDIVNSSDIMLVRNEFVRNSLTDGKFTFPAGATVGFSEDLGPASQRVTLRENKITENAGFGISTRNGSLYEQSIPSENDPFDLDGGPNGTPNYPVIGPRYDQCGLTAGGGLQVRALFNSKPSSTFRLEFYASTAGNNQGERFLGFRDVTTDGIGNAEIIFTPGNVASVGEFITINSTDAEGNTSEFCAARKVNGSVLTFLEKNVSDAEQQQVPHRAPPPAPLRLALAQAAAGTGDGDGDGTPDHTQAHVASFRGIFAHWLTLAAPAGTALRDIVPILPPGPGSAPPDAAFLVGAVQFAIGGLAPGATVPLAQIFHDPLTFDEVLSFGPTAQNATPRWRPLPGVQMTTDSLTATLIDGGVGDQDLTANGIIVALLAPVQRRGPGALGVLGQPVPERDGDTYRSLTLPQSGPFVGSVLRAGKVVPAIFAPDGTVRLDTAGVLEGTLAMRVKKLGVLSGDAVLVTLTGLGVTAASDSALLRGLREGPVRIAAREGDELANAPGVRIKSFTHLDGTGADVFFLATLAGAGVSARNDSALCVAAADGSVRVLLREEQTLGGKKVKTIASLVGLPGTLAEGRWRLDDSRLGARITFEDKSHAIYSFASDGTAAARWIGTADQLADPPLTDASVAALDFPGFGEQGPAFLAGLAPGTAGVEKTNDSTLFRADATGLSVLAREGDAAPGIEISPGTRATFKTFAAPVSGADGRLAFLATVAGVKANVATGLWYAPDGETPALLARLGSAAPGGGKFATFASLALPDGPDSGPLFTGKLAVSKPDGITAANSLGLWAVDREGELALVLRTGQELIVAGTARTLKSFTALSPAKGSFGAASGYDNAGRVTVLATFTDRTVALLELALP